DSSQGHSQRDDYDDDSDAASSTSDSHEAGANGHRVYAWSNYSIPQLRELLRQKGQLTTGNRSALKKRLKNLERSTAASTVATTTTVATAATVTSKTTVASATTTTTTTTTESVTATTIDIVGQSVLGQHVTAEPESVHPFLQGPSEDSGVPRSFQEGESKEAMVRKHPARSRMSSRSNSFSAHFTDFINRRRIALETQRQEISVYTSPMTVLSYFVLYLLHEFRMLLLWIVSQQYLLVVLPLLTAIVYFVYQTDGAHQPLLKHAESGLIWYGYWTLLGVASSVGLGTGLHTFILFLGPHIVEVTLAAHNCGNTDFDVRGDHRFFWGFGTALGELPPYFVARAAALSGNRNEELAAIEDLINKKPDSVSYKERILLMVHVGMKRLGFFGIFLCASIPNPLFDLAGITCGHFLIPFSTFFGATFLGKAVVKSSIQTLFVILMFSADTLAALLSWLEQSIPFLHGFLADGINSQKGALHGDSRHHADADELENSTSLVGLIWNTIIFIMLSYFLLSIAETMALAQIKRRHEQELKELEGKIRSGDTKALFVAVTEEFGGSTGLKKGYHSSSSSEGVSTAFSSSMPIATGATGAITTTCTKSSTSS
ncbi:Vacuolar membrane protease, partial [Lunasporangiospora selenospora]